METKESKLKVWLKELRAHFIIVLFIFQILSVVISWSLTGVFNGFLFFLSGFSYVCIYFGTVIIDDYYDYKSGTDNINTSLTAFSGGSRGLQSGLITPKQVYIFGMFFFSVAIGLGIYLAILTDFLILILGIVGIFIGYFYVHPKVNLAGKGIGEILVAFSVGLVPMIGTYYVQLRSISIEILIIGTICSLFNFSTRLLHTFPDMDADKQVGKNGLVVRFGKRTSVKLYSIALMTAYATIIFSIIFTLIPIFCLLLFVIFPISLKCILDLHKYYSETGKNFERLLKFNLLCNVLLTPIILIIAFILSFSLNIWYLW